MSEDALTRGQVAYRGFAQLCAWLTTAFMWIAPGVYALNHWINGGDWLEGVYMAIGCFVVGMWFRNWLQSEADGAK